MFWKNQKKKYSTKHLFEIKKLLSLQLHCFQNLTKQSILTNLSTNLNLKLLITIYSNKTKKSF